MASSAEGLLALSTCRHHLIKFVNFFSLEKGNDDSNSLTCNEKLQLSYTDVLPNMYAVVLLKLLTLNF